MSKSKKQIDKEYFVYLFGMELTRRVNQILEELSQKYKLPYFGKAFMEVKDNIVTITFKFGDES
jgi:hypothetical protein